MTIFDPPEYACLRCPNVVPVKRRRYKAKFCSKACLRADQNSRYQEINERLPLSTGTIGAIAELAVATDLMRRGHEVFRALSPASSCDLAVVKDGALLRVEVRSGYRTGKGQVRCNLSKKDEGRYDLLAIYLAGEDDIVYESTEWKP